MLHVLEKEALIQKFARKVSIEESNLAKGVDEAEELSGHRGKLDKGRELFIRAVCRKVA